MPVAFMFNLSLADLNKKYRNEIELNKKIVQLVWNMLNSKLGCPESRENHSLTSNCRFKNLKIHELHYVLEVKTCASRVHVSLIPA